ncbi:hypothetical protein EG351_16675 [Chryseobacterium bernardetii]|nr:hypothetical protein EG351_16675 [Chryseobacterium bernardetii]
MKFYFIRIFLHLFQKQTKTSITFILLNHFYVSGLVSKKTRFYLKTSFIIFLSYIVQELLKFCHSTYDINLFINSCADIMNNDHTGKNFFTVFTFILNLKHKARKRKLLNH